MYSEQNTYITAIARVDKGGLDPGCVLSTPACIVWFVRTDKDLVPGKKIAQKCDNIENMISKCDNIENMISIRTPGIRVSDTYHSKAESEYHLVYKC